MTSATDSKDAILDAAEERFAAQGFAPTTIKQIAGDAGVNSALLYYYFADKEALYAEVVLRLMSRVAGEMTDVLASATSPEAAIEAFALHHSALLERHPNVRKVAVRELVDHDASHAQEAFRHLAATTFTRLQAAIAAGQQAGIFRKDLDPRFVAISIVAQTTYFHVARPAIQILLGHDAPISSQTAETYARHVAAFTLAALAPPKDTTETRGLH